MSAKTFHHISLKNSQGNNVTLSNFKGHYIILYFYPKDDTPGCTQEGKDFRDYQTEFTKLNAVILGVSKDTVECHVKFKEKYQLNFELLADTEQELCHALNVIKEKSMYGKKYMGIERSTFLIDPTGKIIQEWRKVKVAEHALEVLNVLKELHKKS